MKKITMVCLALMMAVAGKAISFTHTLSYEGFPYNRTQCEDPKYMIGTKVKISSFVPVKDNIPLVGWSFNGKTYLPGDTLTMPGTDVVLQPIWADEQGVELVGNRKSIIDNRKILRDGQLIIVRDGKEYNIMGGRIQ